MSGPIPGGWRPTGHEPGRARPRWFGRGDEPLGGRGANTGATSVAASLFLVDRSRELLVVAGALVAAILAGGATAALRWLPLAALAGGAGLAWLSITSAATVLTVLLVLRGVTDYFAAVSLVGGLNAGGLVGVAVVAIAGARLIHVPGPRGLPGAALVVGAIGFWLLVAYSNHGLDESLIRELVRTLALVAVALIALNHGGSLTPSRLATMVVWTSMIPAATVVLEAAANWQDLAGTFRARGALAHPNSAGLLFAIAMVLAAWRWACDGGGRSYLLALAFLGFALVLTKSMGGFGQAVLSLVIFALLQGGRANRWVISLVIGAFVVFLVADPFGVSRLDELRTTNIRATEWRDQTNTLDWRLVNGAHFLEVWRETPILGQGFGTTADLVHPIGYEPHSDPLRVLVETGLVGALVFGFAFIAWIHHLVAQWRSHADASFFAAMIALFAGLAAHSQVTHVTLETAPMFLIAVLIGATLTFTSVGLDRDEATTEPSAPGAGRRGSRPTVGGFR